MKCLTLRLLLAALCASLVLVPAVSSATTSSKPTLCERAYGVRQVVLHKYGKAGRNICRFGVRAKGASYRGTTLAPHKEREATTQEKAQYLRQLKTLNAPAPPYLVKRFTLPRQEPAGLLSVSYAPAGLAACIVGAESGGDPTAKNSGGYMGIAQWSQEAWNRMGGRRFAASPLGASYQQQLLILSAGLTTFGCQDWCPFDPC